MSLKDELKKFSNAKPPMKLLVEPIDIAAEPPVRDMRPRLLPQLGTTGLDLDIAKPYREKMIQKFLGLLDYNSYVPEYYDCEDRALWGMAHVRQKFIGCPIGIVDGIAEYPELSDRQHAIIVFWYEAATETGYEYRYKLWDPLPKSGTSIGEITLDPKSGFHSPQKVIAFPIGNGQVDVPFIKDFFRNSLWPTDIKFSVQFDNKYLEYPLRTYVDEKTGKRIGPGMLEYLEDELYEKDGPFQCIELKRRPEAHKPFDPGADIALTDHDKALIDFVHLRRAYPGCKTGLAIGKPKGDGKSSAVIAIWSKTGGNQPIYWEHKLSEDTKGRIVNDFDPKMIIF